MKNNSTTTAFATAATIVTAGVIGITSAPSAYADESSEAGTHGLGSQATLVNGDVVQGWTVSDLKPSTDSISYPVQGTLWEATATDEAINGTVTPIVSNLNARTAGGETYRALYQVATPQGVSPATLPQGEKTTGKVYFDVTGDKPNGVVYNAGEKDLASWAQSQKPQRRSGSPARSAPASSPAVAPAGTSAAAAPAAAPAQPAPAAKPAESPKAGSPGTPPAAGNQASPPPANSPATPPAAGSPAAPAPAAPAPAGGQEAPANIPAAPPAAGSPAAPPAAGSPAAPPAAGSPAAPPAAGSPAAPDSAGGQEAPANSAATPPAAGGEGPSAGSPAASTP